jgi:uncharacterized membrane protein YphA (DoxX/SURF4 family)
MEHCCEYRNRISIFDPIVGANLCGQYRSIGWKQRCRMDEAANIAGANMTDNTLSANGWRPRIAGIVAAPVTRTLALLALCAAYLQGPLTKLFDFQGAIAEMEHFGLHPAAFFGGAVIVFELAASAMILSGFLRWLGALALAVFTLLATFIALRFWEMPAGMEQMMATNAFFEHLGLVGAFVIVAITDLTKGKTK